MAIKKFKKEETNKKNAIKMVSAFMVIGIMLAGISYAVYQHEDEKLFINAKVGEFKENDIELAMKLDGEQIDIPPAKDNYIVTVECDYADGEWDSERWGANVDNIQSGKVKCEVNFTTSAPTLSDIMVTSYATSIELSYTSEGIGVKTTCKWGTSEGIYPNEEEATNTNCNIKGLEKGITYYYQVCAINDGGELCKTGSKQVDVLADKVELGDYISMTPTSTSYTPPSSITGYTGSQNTLNPSELNLWRVIRKNDDGTVDVVSVYMSESLVLFYGFEGYKNYIGTLNTIAAQYTNEKYVAKTRHMGYSDQIEKCETHNNCPADEGYKVDMNMVNEVIKDLKTTTPSGTSGLYWLASRGYESNYIYGRNIKADGSLANYLNGWMYSPKEGQYRTGSHVRPILTLKTNVQIVSGDGNTIETAYRFE